MIEAKETLIGNISSKKTLTGKINNAIEKVYPELEDIIITPTLEEQHFKSEKYGYNNINVQAVNNEIDENIKAENIKSGVSILGINGEANILNGEEITINPTSEVQEITPTAPKNGFTKVIVNAQSGVDINDYFKSNSFTNSSSVNKLFSQIVKKVTSPIDCTGMTSLEYGFESSGLAEFPQLLNTQNVTNGDRIFYNCTNMKTIPLFDTSKITTMQFMFYGCSNLTSVPNFNTSLVTNMYGMFYNCNKLTSVPNFNTEKVENMNSMFQQCYLLENAPSFNTQNVVYIDRCFYNCYVLKTAPEYDFSKVIRCKDMYYGCSNLTTIGGLINLGKAYSTSLGANDYYSGIYLSNDKLTHDSLMNVINNLYDIASKGVKTQKLTLGSTNLAKLTKEEIAIATNKGWSVS